VPWDAAGYDQRFGFVTDHGDALVDLLDPRPGERVVDLGCGTGHLTARIAARGAAVTGLDADPGMLARARAEHPDLVLVEADVRSFALAEPADALFSNATLHWVPEPDQPTMLHAARAGLRRGGRFVAEMGGAGNVSAVLRALDETRTAAGLPPARPRWCFPTPSQQSARLEAAGFRVRLLEHVDRPSLLSDGDTVADWLRMFGRDLLTDVSADAVTALLAETDRRAARHLLRPDGRWWADYVRLRWWAVAC
jgi:trans-aconitate methyltransferase